VQTLGERVVVEVWLRTVLVGGKGGGGAGWPGRFTPGERVPCDDWTGGWVNRRTGVVASEKRSCHCCFNACTAHLLLFVVCFLFLLQPPNAQLYRVIHKSLRNVRNQLGNNHDRHRRVDISSTCKVGQKLGVSVPLLTCSPSAWPSRLLYRRGRKPRIDLWITLYITTVSFYIIYTQCFDICNSLQYTQHGVTCQ